MTTARVWGLQVQCTSAKSGITGPVRHGRAVPKQRREAAGRRQGHEDAGTLPLEQLKGWLHERWYRERSVTQYVETRDVVNIFVWSMASTVAGFEWTI